MDEETRATVSAVARVAGGVAIFIVFLVILMVAIAQQSVVTRLADSDADMSYSSAYATVRDIEAREAQIPALAQKEAVLSQELAERKTELREREEQYHSAWDDFLPLLRRAAGSGACGVSLEGNPLDTPDARLGVWRDIEACAGSGQLSGDSARQFQLLAAGKNSFPVAYRRAHAANGDVERVAEALKGLQSTLAGARNLSDEDKAVKRSFNEIQVLRKSWILGGNTLVEFPPTLVQLLLTAASGAFGSLIITLILIVYPKSGLDLKSSSGGYGPRMLLGALIAISVYVVLLAGTAVMGSTGQFDAAGANYMTFCAVSILAGMFSDRVAAWLSDRANVFFAREDP